MSEFFKKNPIALRHCLLYEYLRKNPVEQSFTALRMTVGPNVIKKKEFRNCFDKFNEGVFDRNDGKEPIADLRDVLRSDKYALRACILYESIKYKLADRGSPTHRLWPNSNMLIYEIKNSPSFSMYNNFCDVVGDNVMGYREFDFWFYRFLNGQYDWSFEMDKDKKIHELMDMPILVMENIVEFLDIIDRMNLARTSRSLQTFVDDQKLFHHALKLNIAYVKTTVSFRETVNAEYFRDWNFFGCRRIFKNRRTHFRGVDHWKQALLDFKSILKNPKLRLDTLKIGLDDNEEHALNFWKDELKFAHHLKVKNLILDECSWETLATILPTLEPGYFTTISIDSLNPNVDSMEKVFEMEQWKRAKCFSVDLYCFTGPLRHLYHFEEFTVLLDELSLEDIRQMKETLFNSPNFEKCSISVNNAADKIEEVFRYSAWQEPNTPEDMKIFHYSIQNSSDYFEIETGRWDIKITKKKV